MLGRWYWRPHSSLVEYLAQVIYAKNCPPFFYCIFQLVLTGSYDHHAKYQGVFLQLLENTPRYFVWWPQEPKSIQKCNIKWWDSFFLISLGLNILPGSCDKEAKSQKVLYSSSLVLQRNEQKTVFLLYKLIFTNITLSIDFQQTCCI